MNRDAMAAFMYRMAGSPVYTPPAKSPFADISTSQQFYKEMAWLASEGISTGWTEKNGTKTYRPLTTVNRDAMAAFMYRLAGKPAYTAPTKSVFADVSKSQQFYKEMAWLASTKISTGWTERNGTKTYRALTPVKRDAMAAFMYRFSEKF
ncbi:S-layer homology domain-containing protein [Arthrobacter sp. CAN_C5]|uniref:S-layer homology domain-containing protein n=1 Tax=Arthrobacter sp. CAN_C5 TaxID=2760706 RepID=UPI0037BFFE42